jgi:hypothetical protein
MLAPPGRARFALHARECYAQEVNQ